LEKDRCSMRQVTLALLLLFSQVLAACAGQDRAAASQESFTLAVIPDTQNYLDYSHQVAEGFALDSANLFIAQMEDIASREDVVFVAAVGDVWQHSSLEVDPAHAARGRGAVENPYLAAALAPSPKARSVEMPAAIEGYRLLARAGIPFGVAPGNHDYDAFWGISGPNLDKPPEDRDPRAGDVGTIHVGGLDNFRSVFGNEGEFFRDKPWYVDSFRGGANSAQVFKAGGYRFLHITLEMSPGDGVLEWAATVIEEHPGYPTIITTHDYLNTRGQRRAHPVLDLAAADPEYHTTAEELWEKLISAYDQVFMVLCGHHHGQSMRIDTNHYGNPVYQLLADYQGRGQAGVDAGQPLAANGRPVGLGDGWYRLMRFDLGPDIPTVKVETWSSHYDKYSRDMPHYADWYRDGEQPGISDEAFYAADQFTLELHGFRERFH
jgi:hypothetical protein